jgi:hypothetical protein
LSEASQSHQRQRHLAAQLEARRQALANLKDVIETPFLITNLSSRVFEAVRDQWGTVQPPHEEGGWDWLEIHRRYRNSMSAMGLAVWTGYDRLAALGLACPRANSVCLEYLEGDPRPDCPIRGRRILIALEAAACYAQALGKPEIRVSPANAALASLYERHYGFVLERPRNEAPYYRKEV